MKNGILIGCGAVAGAASLYAIWLYKAYKENNARYWDWDKLDLDDLSGLESAKKETEAHNQTFMFGTATAAHQIEGNCTNNNWYKFEEEVLKHGAGEACDSWNKWKDDIQLMKKNLGCNSYRFSVEWSKLEPKQGEFDQSAFDHYSEIIDALLAVGIEPMITLHHFCHPIWFESLGAFEKRENLSIFLTFAEKVFNTYSSKCKYWCTFNETEVFVSLGYFQGEFPPGKKDPYLAGIVLSNLLEGHVLTYRLLKTLPNGDKCQIGMVKNLTHFDPYNWWNPLDHYVSNAINHVFNENIRQFFRTGKFNFSLFGLFRSSRVVPQAVGAADFIGLNYYSHYHVKFVLAEDPFEFVRNPMEIQTDMDYPVYAEGISRALKEVASYKLPYVIITENGIADTYDDRRALWIRRYLYSVSKTVKEENIPLRGYFYWSLLDNYEWDKGYKMKFGLHDRQRNLKESSKQYAKIIDRIMNH